MFKCTEDIFNMAMGDVHKNANSMHYMRFMGDGNNVFRYFYVDIRYALWAESSDDFEEFYISIAKRYAKCHSNFFQVLQRQLRSFERLRYLADEADEVYTKHKMLNELTT